jgi:7,8-dihydro-6-hydroxymethylpterin-pyrophosphokinase
MLSIAKSKARSSVYSFDSFDSNSQRSFLNSTPLALE